MDSNVKKQRKIEAAKARRNVKVITPEVVTFFSQMTEEEKAAFHKKEVLKNAKTLRERKIRRTVLTTVKVVLATIAAILAIVPVFFTFLNSFMSSAEIRYNYGMIFGGMNGDYTSVVKYFYQSPTIQLIPQIVSFEQYKTLLFMSPTYLLKFWNSIIMVIPIVVGQLIVSLMASYSFARYRRKRRELLFFFYIIIMLMPFQVTIVPNYIVANKLNLLDTYWAIILPGIFSTFAVFLLTKYMRQIPSTYIEAAKLDGASEWQIFTQIVIPSCKNAIFAILILLFIDYWNMVEQPLLLLSDVNLQPMSVFLSKVNESEIGIAFAASALYMIPPLLIFFLGEEYLIEGISRSGIK